jgi:hypothetical protein
VSRPDHYVVRTVPIRAEGTDEPIGWVRADALAEDYHPNHLVHLRDGSSVLAKHLPKLLQDASRIDEFLYPTEEEAQDAGFSHLRTAYRAMNA